jgi:hypothetical protein
MGGYSHGHQTLRVGSCHSHLALGFGLGVSLGDNGVKARLETEGDHSEGVRASI